MRQRQEFFVAYLVGDGQQSRAFGEGVDHDDAGQLAVFSVEAEDSVEVARGGCYACLLVGHHDVGVVVVVLDHRATSAVHDDLQVEALVGVDALEGGARAGEPPALCEGVTEGPVVTDRHPVAAAVVHDELADSLLIRWIRSRMAMVSSSSL